MSKNSPCINIGIRLPVEVVEQLKAEANAANISLSDALRLHINLDNIKTNNLPTPRKRPPQKLKAVSNSDPALLRQLSAIGNNLNQIARAVNRQALGIGPQDRLELLSQLANIELEIMRIGGVKHDD